ncbi:MAG: glycoside hydrolase family 127 protein, partial [Clostridia bacterium]|nr:glycoside hydrolase family 127 protein [Clostridia bacterium]
MKHIPFYHTKLNGAFWGEKQRVSKEVTVDAVYDRFAETKRFEALKCDAEQQAREGWHTHFFWDSDIAKWIEGAAYILERGRNDALEAKVDAIIDDMCANQMADGYYNCFFKIYDTEKRFTIRDRHELYCLGHLIEAAIAYRHATGKDKLLCMVERYVDYVIRVFTV